MKVVVAPDKFAGSLSAVEAADSVARGWLRADPTAEVDRVPLSDGGPGFVEVLHAALGGRLVPAEVRGPLGTPVRAHVLVHETAGRRTAYVESAQACGLALVHPTPRTALEASTAGVGDLLRVALDARVDRVVVGVGGTASTDGGSGCLESLGGIDAWPRSVGLVVATDVTAPLLGLAGAARVFGPQKGADPAAVRQLEGRLERWARESGGDPTTPGAGAGGGLGYGLLLLGAAAIPGVATVLAAVELRRRLSASALAITGEGRFDTTSLLGKVPSGVAALARELAVPCVVLAGDSTLGVGLGDPRGRDHLARSGITTVHTLVAAYGREAALARPADRLADLAEHVARTWDPPVPPS